MPILISDAYESLCYRCRAERYRPSSIEFYNHRLPPFIAWCKERGIVVLEDVTARHVREFMVDAQTLYRGTDKERQAAGHTVHAAARALRAFFNFCVSDELIATSPMRSIKMPRKPRKILDAFSVADAQRLIQVAGNDRDRAIVYFLLDTGVRAQEFVDIILGDVDQQARSVHIRHGKGDKSRIVYFGEKTAHQLVAYLRGCPDTEADQPLWRNLLRGTALTRFGLSQLLRRLGNVASVTNCNPHAFRRAFALNCLRNGMNIYTLARLMGHTDISVLRQYLALTEDDLSGAHARFGVVDKLAINEQLGM